MDCAARGRGRRRVATNDGGVAMRLSCDLRRALCVQWQSGRSATCSTSPVAAFSGRRRQRRIYRPTDWRLRSHPHLSSRISRRICSLPPTSGTGPIHCRNPLSRDAQGCAAVFSSADLRAQRVFIDGDIVRRAVLRYPQSGRRSGPRDRTRRLGRGLMSSAMLACAGSAISLSTRF